MKKFLAILLAMVMVLSLVACGEKPVDDPQGDDPGQSEGVPAGRVEVLMWSAAGGSVAAELEAPCERYHKQHCQSDADYGIYFQRPVRGKCQYGRYGKDHQSQPSQKGVAEERRSDAAVAEYLEQRFPVYAHI